MNAQKAKQDLSDVDPSWAWKVWEPSESEPWDAGRIAHLHRRAGFGAGRKQIDESEKAGFQATVDGLFAEKDSNSQGWQETSDLAKAVLAGGDPRQLSGWWLRWMRLAPDALREKTTLFWHGHFATSADKVKEVRSMYDQNLLLREHALGDFGKMVHAISKDPAMLLYLDSAYNRKAHPNENFARELLELFCMGLGNYTEKDIQELARCFTGWEIRRNRFRFNSYQHDNGKKSIFGRDDIESGEQAVDWVLEQPTTPMFIASKLFRFFLRDEPTAPDELIKPLAKQLRDDGLRVEGTIRTILSSQIFYSDLAIAKKVRSPVELAVTFLKSMDATTNYRRLADSLNLLGQVVFYPPSVKGWDGGRAWINSSTLVGRANLIHQIARDENTQFDSMPIGDWAKKNSLTEPMDFINFVCDQLFAVMPSAQSKMKIAEAVKDSGGRRYIESLSLLASLPELQIG